MKSAKFARFAVLAIFIFLGVWLITKSVGLGAETVEREQAIQAFAPAPVSTDRNIPQPELQGVVKPVTVNLSDVPAGVHDTNSMYDRWLRGEIDLDENEGARGEAEIAAMRAAARNAAPTTDMQVANSGPVQSAPSTVNGWASIDYTECCGGGGSVPPDPELAVGPNHVIAAVNVALEIYDKSGNSLVGPVTFDSFMSSDPNCTGLFDPNANYDEEYDRYVLGIDADGTHYCVAVSQTGDPTGNWNIYSFPTISSSRDFFDYPHAGIGRDAIYMGANIFGRRNFKQAQVWAFDKVAMYNGQAAASQTVILGSSHFTPQPLNLHGWAQGTWPTSGPHYIFADTGFNGSGHSVFAWDAPFGTNSFSTVGTLNLNAAAGMPVNTPQQGGQTVQANDFRPQDFEYRNGYAWTSSTVACNPGSGTVNCVRWAQIDPANATVVDQGVYGSNGEYRTFADLAVDACGNMAIGYSKSSSSMYPGVFATGRLATDPAGTLQPETQLKAGEITYTSFETSAPRRWGDYTEMTIDPAGETFWYLGEYSKDTGTTNGRWGTYIASMSYGCGSGTPPTPPTVTITSPANGASFNVGDSVSFAGTAVDNDDGDITANLSWTSNIDGAIGSGGSFSTSSLSAGNHTITASVADAEGTLGSAVINITVNGAGGGNGPVITNVQSTSLNGNSFAISWDTDIPADSTVSFTCCGDYNDPALVTSHYQSFNGQKNATYTYYVTSVDANGNATTEGPFTHQN